MPRAWGLDDWCSDVLCDRVAEVVATHGYDAVIVNYVWMSRVLDRISGPLKILDTHDLFGGRREVAESAGIEPRWFFTTVEEENRGFGRADIVLGIQSNESRKIAVRASGTTLTVGHPIDPHCLATPSRAPYHFKFGYIGSGNPFNVACVKALDFAIAQSGEIEWTIAGTISKRLPDLRSHPFRMGIVDSVVEFYADVECVLNPMLGGTGLKIKTIEALAFGKPIIGTIDAFEGIETDHELHQLADCDAFADAMREYERSESLSRDLQKATYRVYANYMAEVSTQYDTLAEMIRAPRGQPQALRA